MKHNSKIMRTLLLLVALTMGGLQTFAQLTNVRYDSQGSQPLDITMISSMVLQPMWLTTSSTATNVTPVRAITTEEQLLAGDALNLNNRIAGTRGINSDRIQNLATNPIRPLIPPQSTNGTNIWAGMVYADCDEDNTTFQSSAAFLDFGDQMACTQIEKAYLYWSSVSGTTVTYATPYPNLPTMMSYTGSGASLGQGNNGNTDNVLFKPTGEDNYISVTGTRVNAQAGECNTFVADVTEHVQGRSGGLFWVANVKSGVTDTNASTGWSLVVIYRPPNAPPRSILLVDGSAGDNSTVTLTLTEPPATTNSVSYLGFIGTDSENMAINLIGPSDSDITNCAAASAASVLVGNVPIRIQPNNGPEVRIAQFTDQPSLPFISSRGGRPIIGCQVTNPDGSVSSGVFDGSVSSTLSTFNKTTGLNGSDFTRLPSVRYTAGYDAHHVRLLQGAITQGATSVRFTLPEDGMGGYSARMAYLAIETLQADLNLKLESLTPNVAPGGEITYRLTVENIGPVASTTGRIENPLVVALDFVPGSVVYAEGTYNVTGQSTDNEMITFTTPAIPANGSVVIEYRARVKDLSSPIWIYGCNREISNMATLFYLNAKGEEVVAGSNAGSAGCDGLGVPEITEVVSQELEDQYIRTHIITLTEDSDLVQRIQNSAQPDGTTTINIVTELRAILAQQYALLGLDPADLSRYTINREGFPVQAGATFIVVEGEGEQRFTADALLDGGCEERFTFILELIKVPSWTATPTSTSCAGFADAKLSIVVSNGTPGYSVEVTDASNNIVFTGFSPDTYDTFTFVAEGLAAGVYNVEVCDKNGCAPSGQVTIADPVAIVPSVTSQCTATGVQLNATATARPGATLQYAWTSSLDGFTTITTGQSLDVDAADTGTYRLTVCDNACYETKDVILPNVAVTVNPTVVSILATNPQADFTAVVTPSSPTYTYQWAMSQGTLPGTLTNANTSVLTVSNVTNLIMNGNLYKVSVTEPGLGCVGTAEGELVAVEAPVVTLDGWTQASCPDASDGTMTVTIERGTDLQQYNIVLKDQSGQTVHSLTYTAPAPQQVTVSGLSGCAAENPLTGECMQSANYTWYVNDIQLPNPIPYGPFTITAVPRPVTELTVDDVCFGEELIASASGNHPSYQWTINGVLDATTQSVYIHDYPLDPALMGSTVDIRVVALSNLGCQSLPQSAIVELKAVPDPLVQRAPVPFTICAIPGEVLDWVPLVENPDEYELKWFDTQIGGIGIPNPNVINLAVPGDYSKYVVAVTDGCPSLRTEIKATVFQNPRIVSIDVQDLQVVKIVVTDGRPHYIYDYQGFRGDFDTFFELTATKSFPFALGQHNFLVIDQNGCETEGSFFINKTVIEPAPYFSPNGDGDVDHWRIEHLNAYLDAHITIDIFDRQGKRLAHYAAKDFPVSGWDGRYNGELLPSTDYWYSIYIEQTDERIVGNFTLKR